MTDKSFSSDRAALSGTVPGDAATVIKDDDVYWEMRWDQTRHAHKPPTERIFEEGPALARMLASETIFLNCFHWESEWPKEARDMTALCVNCNDVFAWGCADAETLRYEDIQDLYDHWIKDRHWGVAVWCCKKRGELPQAPVLKSINSKGIWDMGAMNLRPNAYDAYLVQQGLKPSAPGSQADSESPRSDGLNSKDSRESIKPI
jgi:hypothetical protein